MEFTLPLRCRKDNTDGALTRSSRLMRKKCRSHGISDLVHGEIPPLNKQQPIGILAKYFARFFENRAKPWIFFSLIAAPSLRSECPSNSDTCRVYAAACR